MSEPGVFGHLLRKLAFEGIRRDRRYRRRREDILDSLPKNSVGAELGVFKGEFSKQILLTVRPRALSLVDVWWSKHGEHYPDWGSYTDHGRLRTRDAHAAVLKIVEQCGGDAAVSVHVGDDVAYLLTLPDHYFDWVYLDSSHLYEHTKAELEVLDCKVKSDGLIAGDDWQEDPGHAHHGVCRAVREFCSHSAWRLEFVDNHTQWLLRRRP